ncbi:MAG: zf-HC2 domain-containing protein [Phycisphaerae bacterium]|nr:zf-HC2 domain-containing protein [Phycisphaerae bacterium]
MNCEQLRALLVEYVEEELAPDDRAKIDAHLTECSACQREVEAHRRLHDRLLADGLALRGSQLEDRVVDRILREQTHTLRRFDMRNRWIRASLGFVAVAAAVAVAFTIPWSGQRGSIASAAEVMRQGIAALADIHAVYLRLNVRTVGHDNFEFIGLDYDFVENEMWKRFDEPTCWRAEKPGRVLVMDGTATTGLIRPNHAFRQGAIPSSHFAWIGELMDVGNVLETELGRAEGQGSTLTVREETGADGKAKLVVTVEAAAQGDFTNDWLKNKSVSASDNRRVYRFDAATQLLEDLEVFVKTDAGEVMVLETLEIDYNPALDPGLFTLELPDNVVWHEEAGVLADNDRYAAMGPGEVARAFFEACGAGNWDEVLKFFPVSEVDERVRSYLGGLKIVSLGEPFKSGRYPGWFVPYEIRLQNGEVHKHNLAVRNDNPAGRYVIDGGI